VCGVLKATCVHCSAAFGALHWSGAGLQPPHKQKAETYRSTSGRKTFTPTPLQRRAPKAEEQRTQVALHTPHT